MVDRRGVIVIVSRLLQAIEAFVLFVLEVVERTLSISPEEKINIAKKNKKYLTHHL